MENTANRIDLRGDLVALPVLSHENHGQRFYRFFLDVARLSGTADRLPIIAAQSVLEEMDLSAGSRITVTGQVRSYHVRTEARRKLLLFVYARSLQTSDAAPLNDVFLSGTICKPPVCRRTPPGAADLRCHPGRSPPLPAGGLSALHFMGAERRRSCGSCRRR